MTAPRTIVISDAHGYPGLIRNALRHSGFRAGEDVLVYAGDFVHRGPAAAECIAVVEGRGRLVDGGSRGDASAASAPVDPRPGDVVVLWGNHDLAVLLDRFTYPNSPPAGEVRPLLIERFRGSGWHLATCVGRVLITHAGVSTDYAAMNVTAAS